MTQLAIAWVNSGQRLDCKKGTLKTTFGHSTTPYAEAIEKSGLSTLQERRLDLFDKFAVKLANNPEYENWLPKTTFTGCNLRRELVFLEKYSATDFFHADLDTRKLFKRRKLFEDTESFITVLSFDELCSLDLDKYDLYRHIWVLIMFRLFTLVWLVVYGMCHCPQKRSHSDEEDKTEY